MRGVSPFVRTIAQRTFCMRRCGRCLETMLAQKGSLVSDERLRFDISHPKPISEDELARVEEIANGVVVENAPVVTRLMGVDEAIASGARALFGEKMAMRCALFRWASRAPASQARPIRSSFVAAPTSSVRAISVC